MEGKIKKIIFVLILFIVILGIIIIIYSDLEKEKDSFEGLGYINNEWSYGFNPPEGFYLKDTMYFNQSVIFQYVPEEDEIGQLNLYLYATNISAKITYPERPLKEIAQELEDSLVKSSDSNLSLISYDLRTVNGMKIYDILFEYLLDPNEDQASVWGIISVIKDDRVIQIQIMGNSSLYYKKVNEIDKSLESFVILELEEEEWDLEKYYVSVDEINKTFIMTAREHFEDRAIILYFSNVKIFYKSLNAGDTIIIQDNISNLSYDEILNTTSVSFEWNEYGATESLDLLFEGNITSQYIIGDRVNITVTLIRVELTYEGVNYDLEIFAENWVNEDYFKENIRGSEITQGLKLLSQNLIEKV